jgi:LuxR family quorum-sensing system transcriptional regulator CciR
MRRLTDRFAEGARSCGTLLELKRLIDDAVRDLGFRFFALLHHRGMVARGGRYVRLDNYPEAWVGEWVANRFWVHDPVHVASHRTDSPFTWSSLAKMISLSAQQRAILHRSRSFGIGRGFTIPLSALGEARASCSFAVECGTRLPAQRLISAEQIGWHAFAAATRLQLGARASLRPHLSPREIDCLRLVAQGKTDWEIATILGIAAETARQYVKNARVAYNAVSRTQLAVLALEDGLIGFEELPRTPGATFAS